MEANKSTTVLFAEPSSNAQRYEASRNAVCKTLMRVADATGGRVIKSIGGKLMIVFPTPDAAASAASKMHATLAAQPAVDGTQLAAHVGFHSDPSVRRGTLSDDTVKFALQLLQQAQDGQTITSEQTANQLDPAFRGFSKSLRAMPQAENVRLFEVTSWHQQGVRPQGWSAMAVLRLTWGEQLLACSREHPTIVVGRDDDCDLIVDNRAASRRHCTIEYCQGDFVVRDHSSNGTYVTVKQGSEILLKGDKLSLPEEGALAIGRPRAKSPDVVEFAYALVT